MKNITVVTGAAGVLGRAVGVALRSAGHEVVGMDLAEIPSTDSPFTLRLSGVDLTQETSVSQSFGDLEERFGGLNGLVNVAGGFRWETVADGQPESWDFLYRINVVTSLLASRAALPLLEKRQGAIVNISAAGSVKAGMGMGAYAASKSGVSRMTEALAEEWKDRHVRINAVLPSIIDTPANRADMADADFSRWVSPDELAAVILFLLSPAASAVTGALLPVTGRV